jgi:2-methylcitrate dehydratase
MKDEKHEKREAPRGSRMGRRDLMKLGAGVVATALTASKASAQRGAGGAGQPPAVAGPDGVSYALPVRTRAGYVYEANRESSNGPMDDTSRTIVTWANGFTYSKLTAAEKEMLNRIMLDYMAALVSGFDEPSVRLAASCAAQVAPRKLGCTVMGYGFSTSLEMGAFANSAMGRHTDFNDLGPGGHTSDCIPACFAAGEAMHSTGEEFLAAIAVGYELSAAGIGGGESAHTGVAAGKLLKLNDDRLANALTLALTPHVTLNKGVGAMSMWKGLRSAEPVKCGMWGAVMAHEGITGPPQPYEGRGGLWSRNGRKDITLPLDPKALALMRMGFKRYPAEGSSQSTLDNIPEMRAFAKVDEIERVEHWLGGLGEIADAPKWDPHNRETADHSMPYILARALIDGEIYLGSFTEAKFRDPQALELMKKITMSQGVGFTGNGAALTVITKKNGEKKPFPAQGGRRRAPEGELLSKPTADHRLTMEEIVAKFNRACEYKKVDNAQRDKARAVWSNIASVKDIGDAIKTMAKFGTTKPLLTT